MLDQTVIYNQVNSFVDQLHPLAQELIDYMDNKEYRQANRISNKLMETILSIKEVCIRNRE